MSFGISEKFRKKIVEPSNGNKNGSVNGKGYSFEDFVVDPSNRICTRGGASIPVSGKVYDILLAFVENPGRLLTKDELIDRVWPDEFVEEGNLARNVSSLRKALGDTGKVHKYILTVPGHGYRFAADVCLIDRVSSNGTAAPQAVDPAAPVAETQEPVQPHSRKLFWLLAGIIVLFSVAWFGKDRMFPPAPTVRSIAVLPLRGIDPQDNYLGVGIADAVIRRLGASGQVTVRPTSAVLHYANQETDSLAAARDLNADAILEGTIQRSADKFRVSLNLIRTADGSSLWNNSYNLVSADIFEVQDDVARQVAQSLKVRLSSSNVPEYPVNPVAYDWYMRGVYSLDIRRFNKSDLPHMIDTIDYFERSIEADPDYAAAHGQLAFCYVWMAMFVDAGEPKWAGLAREQIAKAEQLDPTAAEPHIANGMLYWGSYGGYNIESAIRELRLAKQLDPNASFADLSAIYGHAGLERQAMDELKRAGSIDPTSQALNGLTGILPYLRGDAEAWLAAYPNVPLEDRPLSRWYYMQTGQLDLAKDVMDKQSADAPDEYDILAQQAVLAALKGDFPKAKASLTTVFTKVQHNDESYHHETYAAACVYALEGNGPEAVKWLRETANSGFPNYPLFSRDRFLDRIRQSPEFIQFLSEQKAQYDRFEQEFPDA